MTVLFQERQVYLNNKLNVSKTLNVDFIKTSLIKNIVTGVFLSSVTPEFGLQTLDLKPTSFYPKVSEIVQMPNSCLGKFLNWRKAEISILARQK